MMGYKLVIAEKPSVAQSLAAVIGATVRKDGYLEGNGWRVSWCVGHLAGLADAPVDDHDNLVAHVLGEGADRSLLIAVVHVLHVPDVVDRKSTRLNSSHSGESRMPSSA